jgi:beta-N-acetylhexosaminidase
MKGDAETPGAARKANAHRRGWRRELRQIGIVALVTFTPWFLALHFVYGALDTRYRHLWGFDRPSPPEAAAPARGAAADSNSEPGVAAMSGQLLMVGFQGTSLRGASGVRLREVLAKGEAGGVILFERNITSPPQLKALTAALRDAATSAEQPPPLIAVDQEGGQVRRLDKGNGFLSLAPSAKRVAERCTPPEAERLYRAVACELREAGINVNLAPVVDLDLAGDKNPVIGRRERSFGPDAASVVRFGAAFLRAHDEAGIGTALKHFPGHGSSLSDTHEGFTDITGTFQPQELQPFRKLAGSGADPAADMVMVGHVHHAAWSREGEPATFSRRLIEEELRDRMGFKGVIISDDLEMGAIRQHYGLDEAMVRAIGAGVDMVILANTGAYSEPARDAHKALAAAIKPYCPPGSEGACVSEARIREAYGRVIRLKDNLDQRREQTAAACKKEPEKPSFTAICQGKEQVASWWNWVWR